MIREDELQIGDVVLACSAGAPAVLEELMFALSGSEPDEAEDLDSLMSKPYNIRLPKGTRMVFCSPFREGFIRARLCSTGEVVIMHPEDLAAFG